MIVSFLNCFAAGIFLGTCILHMMPEVSVKMDEAFGGEYPFGELVFALGFFFILMFEQLVMMCCVQKTPVVEPVSTGGEPVPLSPPIDHVQFLSKK